MSLQYNYRQYYTFIINAISRYYLVSLSLCNLFLFIPFLIHRIISFARRPWEKRYREARERTNERANEWMNEWIKWMNEWIVTLLCATQNECLRSINGGCSDLPCSKNVIYKYGGDTHTHTRIHTHTHAHNRARLIKSKNLPKLRLWFAMRAYSTRLRCYRSPFICQCWNVSWQSEI